MENQTIQINCAGNITLGVDELTQLQGELKTLSEKDYVKLRNSIVQYGFSFPVFFWQDSDGKKYIIDSHQRIGTLKKMREEGWTIPPLPADPIFAKDKKEAKEKLLVLNSRYGKITETGLTDFVNEIGSEIQIDDISDMLTFPEFNFETETNNPTQSEDKGIHEVVCPNCQTKFIPN